MPRHFLFACIFVVFVNANMAQAHHEEPNELLDFATDGCSMSPDGLPMDFNNFLPCCIQHDVAYWKGGAEEEKRAADLQLRQCISEKSISPIGWLYYLGVLVGGSPNYKTTFRWGYGWKFMRGFRALTDTEKQMAEEKLAKVDFATIPITEGYPPSERKTISGSYCLDEVSHILLARLDDPKRVQGIDPLWDIQDRLADVVYAAHIQGCSRAIIFRFSATEFTCQETQYSEQLQSYLTNVDDASGCLAPKTQFQLH